MSPPAATRLYLHDDHCFEADAHVVAVLDNAVAFDRACFYPGGGQPPDAGSVMLQGGEALEIVSAHAGPEEIVWHAARSALPTGIVGQAARLTLNRERRRVFTRHHTVLHVLNTDALKDYQGWITGVQIGTGYSRIDFKPEGISAALCAELENKGRINKRLYVRLDSRGSTVDSGCRGERAPYRERPVSADSPGAIAGHGLLVLSVLTA